MIAKLWLNGGLKFTRCEKSVKINPYNVTSKEVYRVLNDFFANLATGLSGTLVYVAIALVTLVGVF